MTGGKCYLFLHWYKFQGTVREKHGADIDFRLQLAIALMHLHKQDPFIGAPR